MGADIDIRKGQSSPPRKYPRPDLDLHLRTHFHPRQRRLLSRRRPLPLPAPHNPLPFSRTSSQVHQTTHDQRCRGQQTNDGRRSSQDSYNGECRLFDLSSRPSESYETRGSICDDQGGGRRSCDAESSSDSRRWTTYAHPAVCRTSHSPRTKSQQSPFTRTRHEYVHPSQSYLQFATCVVQIRISTLKSTRRLPPTLYHHSRHSNDTSTSPDPRTARKDSTKRAASSPRHPP
jgi:hypothetical protein